MFHVCLYCTALSVPCSLVITCLGKGSLVSSFFHFLSWCLGSGVVLPLIPDRCLILYFLHIIRVYNIPCFRK